MNQRGQVIVETILILALFVGISALVAAGFRQNELFHNIVSAPWKSLSGMLQNGVWQPPGPSMARHPTNHSRHISVRGDKPK